jgi:uncharacterized protein YegL
MTKKATGKPVAQTERGSLTMAQLFKASEFAASKAKPLPIILLLDTSDSMNIVVNPDEVIHTGRTGFADGQEVEYVEGGKTRIDVLNEATRKMINTLKKGETQASEFLVSIIAFGGNEADDPIGPLPAAQITYSNLNAEGLTPLGSALAKAKALVEDKEKTPSRAYRPLIVLVSDGAPNDSWEGAFQDFIENGRSAKCDRMALAIGEDADKVILGRFVEGTGHDVFNAEQAEEIVDFFKYVTMSVTTRTNSANPNEVPNDSTLTPPAQGEDQAPAPTPSPAPTPAPAPIPESTDDEEESYW